ncbi:MAG TPA: manganese catalase family protein [Terracidiphilus sp.]|jgi:Mn-containing catalase|nr:manganese catalase family protein [Terracidiphilus sp.]
MFHHVKELQFNARVSQPDPKFAALLLEQFGGANGELTAALSYFLQAFPARQPYPDKYDMLMDIATEEFSHLEIVGATIQMLLGPVNAELQDATTTKDLHAKADASGLSKLTEGGKAGREDFIHQALLHPEFVINGCGPHLTNCQGASWSGQYVSANSDLTVDLRSDIGAEARAKIVYEQLMQFTDDPLVKESLAFLMTREISHMQMFQAALESIQPNFPPAILQGDPRYTHVYTNMSDGASARGPWNEGSGPWQDGQPWQYVQDPISAVRESDGLLTVKPHGQSPQQMQNLDKQLSQQRKKEVSSALPEGQNQWSAYPQSTIESPRRKAS